MIFLLAIACTPAFEGNFEDSQPVHDGWSAEAKSSGEGIVVPGQALRVPIQARLSGVPPCEGCVVEHEADLQIEVHLPKVLSGPLNLSLMRDGELVVARTVADTDHALLSAPIFEGCFRGCSESLELDVAAKELTPLEWRALGRSVSTQDRQGWSAANAQLSLKSP
jgi:hypothetical protein